MAKAGVSFVIFFDGKQTIVSESEDVAGQGVALGGIDFEEFESAGFEEFYSFYREPGEIDEGGMIVEETDQGHQMEACGGSGAVREWRGENFDSFRREEIAHLLNAGGVGAVAVADQQSLGIEPEDISGFGGAGGQ